MNNQANRIKLAAQVATAVIASLLDENNSDMAFGPANLKATPRIDEPKEERCPASKIVEIVKAHPGIVQVDLISRMIDECGVSQSTAYRKMEDARAEGLLAVDPIFRTVTALQKAEMLVAQDYDRCPISKVVEIVESHPGVVRRGDLIEIVMKVCGVCRLTACNQIRRAVRAKKLSLDPARDAVIPYTKGMDSSTMKLNRFPTSKIVEVVTARGGIKMVDLVRHIVETAKIARVSAYQKVWEAVAKKAVCVEPTTKLVVPYREVTQ